MSSQTHHNDLAASAQGAALIGDSWASEVVPLLPADLEQQARKCKALLRLRKLRCAADLLRAILAYVLCGYSFAAVGAWAVLLGLADISSNGWRKRMRRANAWLAWLLSELLATPPSGAQLSACRSRRVRLCDTTRLAVPGGSGDDWRLHSSYNLLNGRLDQLTLTDGRAAEGLRHFQLLSDDLIVGDSAYGYRKSIASVVGAQADAVLRIYPPTFPVVDAAERPLDLYRWLRRQGGAVRSQTCLCLYQGQRYRVRLIACKLPAAEARAARRRKWQEARDHGRKVTWQTLFYAGWVVLVTTLSESEWSDEEVLRIYRARWQIELVFKRMKQLLKLAQLRSQQQELVEVTVRALLIAWALMEGEAAVLRELFVQVAHQLSIGLSGSAVAGLSSAGERPLSSWLLTQLCLSTLRQQVQGQWSRARVRACARELQRFLHSSPRRRRHQETEVRSWLSRRERSRTQAHQQAA
jgi:hypothetical protein